MHQQRKDPLEGTTVDGRYVVHSRLARGGMSTVYVATDRRLDRRVALKVLYPHLAEEPGFIDRFEQEAKSAARLSHPRVVGVLDQGVGEVEGQPLAYLVMEFVPGRTLRDVLRERGRLTPRDALGLVDAVVEGLAAAHDAGLIHRDVKPENVLISTTDQVKIADFGLARAVSASTGTATLVGTVAYLSPELVLGRPAEAQSDIYSTGVMLFELLTGRQPFTGETPIQVAIQHAQSVVPAPSELLPGLAPDIDELVQWCTARDPEDRPVDGTALLGELRHICSTLTDDELDFALPSPEPAHQDDRLTIPAIHRTRVTDDGTDVLPPAPHQDDRTRVIPRDRNATSVIGAAPVDPPSSAAASESIRRAGSVGTDTTDRSGRGSSAAPPLTKRQQARQSQRPEKSLHGRTAQRSFRLLVVLLVLLASLVAGAGWLFGAGPAGIVSMPDVINATLREARTTLGEEGLASLTTRQVFDDTVLAGLVVGTDPSASAEVRRFEQVDLTVSKGPELFRVPDLVGKTEVEAAAELGAAGLAVGASGKEYSETIPAGDVIRQTPDRGIEQRRNSDVDLTVSLGPAPITVPDVSGLGEQEAFTVLEEAGLAAVIDDATEFSRSVPAGAVLTQNPVGAQVQRGTTVTLTLSAGPRIVRVPDVFSLSEDRATTALEAAGFDVQVDYTFGRAVLGLVAGQSSTGDQPEGTTIRITVT